MIATQYDAVLPGAGYLGSPGDHRPDPRQCGLVLDAVKAWPGSVGAR